MTIEYFIKTNSDLSINNGYLSIYVDDKETILIESFKFPTKKGWLSTKKIFEDLDIIYSESDCDHVISKKCALKLVDKYKGVNVKIWSSIEEPIYESISERNEIKYSDGVSMNGVKGIDY